MVPSPQPAITTGRTPARVSTPPSPMTSPRRVIIAACGPPPPWLGNETCGAGDSGGGNEPLVVLEVTAPVITTSGPPASYCRIGTFPRLDAKYPPPGPARGPQTPPP